ncbi:MAG: hypothetical protein ACOVNS_04290, partial [Erythrobacter sp.]
MPKLISTLPLAAIALALPAMAQAQDYGDLPPLAPMAEVEVRQLPPEYRTAPTAAPVRTTETREVVDGVETITRTRFIELPANPAPRGHMMPAPMNYAPAPGYAPVVFEREQWLDECRRRTKGRDKDDTGTIILGLLGAVAGGIAGYEIAGVGDRVLGTVLGVGGGGLLGGLIGSLFDGDDDEDRYDCEAAIDNYLSAYGAPGTRIAAREIAYAPYPMSYGYSYYAPPPQMVMVPVRSQVQ